MLLSVVIFPLNVIFNKRLRAAISMAAFITVIQTRRQSVPRLDYHTPALSARGGNECRQLKSVLVRYCS